LSVLFNLFLPIQPDWEWLRPALEALTTFAIEFRYPGVSANQAIANQAFQHCVAVRQIVRQYLAL